MTTEQIQAILAGDFEGIPAEEAVAVLFGQHYADSKEQPSEEAIKRLIEDYGFAKAECVLAACQMITMTNGMGIAMDRFYHRITFRKEAGSRILQEIVNPLMTMVLFPILVVGYKLRTLLRSIHILPPTLQMES